MRATVAELRREVDFENAEVAAWAQRTFKDNSQVQTTRGVDDIYMMTSGFDHNHTVCQSAGTVSLLPLLLEQSGPMEGLETGGCRVDDNERGHTARDLPRKPHSDVADRQVEYIDIETLPSSSDSEPSQSPTPARRRLARARASDA